MNKDDPGAVESTALETSECIGPMADVPILQVMSPTVSTVGTPLVPIETMADTVEKKDLRREKLREVQGAREEYRQTPRTASPPTEVSPEECVHRTEGDQEV